MNNTLSTISKFLMVVIGCLIVYYLMNLAGNSKTMMEKFAEQQQQSSKIEKLGRQVEKLQNKIEQLQSGVDRKAGSYMTQKEVAAEVLAASRKTAEESIANKKMINKLASLIEENKKQLVDYQDIMNEAEEKISAVSENIAGMQVDENADFKVSYPVKNQFSINNEKKIGELQKTLDRVAAVNVSLKKELKEVSAKIKNMESEVTVKQLVVAEGQEKDIAGSLVDAFQKSVKAASESSRKSLQELERKVAELQNILAGIGSADKNDMMQYQKELEKKIAQLQGEMNDGSAKNDMSKYQQELAAFKKEVSNKIVGQYQKVAQGLENDLEVLNEKFNIYKEKSAQNWGAIEVKLQNLQESAAGIADSKIEKLAGQLKAQLAILNKEYEGLKESVSALNASGAKMSEREPAAGIVVTKTFDNSLILLNTDKGSFVFNPYKDFTGVIRVRDLDGSETIIRVPYSGNYQKISGEMLDDGPFARSCALGMNCNLEARGSFSGKVKVE